MISLQTKKRVLVQQVLGVGDPQSEPMATTNKGSSELKRLCHDLKKLASPSKPSSSSHSSSDGSSSPGLSAFSPCSPADGSGSLTTLQSIGFPLFTVEAVERKTSGKHLTVSSATLVDPLGGNSRTCILKDFWVQTDVVPGDQVMIIGTFDELGTCVVDDYSHFLIMHPDTLISPTLIGGANYCMRKALLQDMIRAETTLEMFVGTLVHDLMQRMSASILAAEGDYSSVVLLDKLLRDPRYRQDMYALQLSDRKVKEIASSFIPNIEKWASEELKKPGTEIADIEEWIWSPRYGVKGRVDMTMRINGVIKPLEIKTGKANFTISHCGQVLLYTLLLSEKHRTKITEGILFYAKTGEWKTITAKHVELRGLIQMRNDISGYLKRVHIRQDKVLLNLPSPINDSRACSKCQLSTMCALFHQTVEDKYSVRKSLPTDHYIHRLVESKTQHLKQLHLDYFEKWMVMLYMEVQNSQKDVSVLDMWLPKDLELDKPELSAGDLRLTEIKGTVTQQLNYCLQALGPSNIALYPGDLVILREDSHEGVVVDLCTINLIEKEPILRLELHADRFFKNPMLTSLVFRVSKYVYSASSMAGSYDSLMKLMETNVNAERLRNLFLDKVPPRMGSQVSKTQLLRTKDLIKPLPKAQQTAVVKCLLSTDYLFIDTKTCEEQNIFISTFLRVLHGCDQTVLFVCSNNSTLDSLLQMVHSSDPSITILRLGPATRAKLALRDLCAETVAAQNSYADMSEMFSTSKITATTNSSHRQPGLMHRQFDICLVHETSLMLQPSIFGFLFLASKFVFIGDSTKHPSGKTAAAVSMGLQESLMTSMAEVARKCEAWVEI